MYGKLRKWASVLIKLNEKKKRKKSKLRHRSPGQLLLEDTELDEKRHKVTAWDVVHDEVEVVFILKMTGKVHNLVTARHNCILVNTVLSIPVSREVSKGRCTGVFRDHLRPV